MQEGKKNVLLILLPNLQGILYDLTMQKELLLVALMLFLGCNSSNKEPTDAVGLGFVPGTENPVIKECSVGKAYLYNEYEIHVEPSPDEVGMNIFLYSPKVSDGNPCKLDRKTASHIISTGETEEKNFFAGIYKEYLFIDQGTGPDRRILSIYNLKDKKLILFTEYSSPNLKSGVLTFYKTLVPDPGVIESIPCPDAQEWRNQGLTVLYEQKETFTLETEIRTPVREYRCRAGQ